MSMTNDVHSLIADLRGLEKRSLTAKSSDEWNDLRLVMAAKGHALADDAEKMLGAFGAFLDYAIANDVKPGHGSEVWSGPVASRAAAIKKDLGL